MGVILSIVGADRLDRYQVPVRKPDSPTSCGDPVWCHWSVYLNDESVDYQNRNVGFGLDLDVPATIVQAVNRLGNQ